MLQIVRELTNSSVKLRELVGEALECPLTSGIAVVKALQIYCHLTGKRQGVERSIWSTNLPAVRRLGDPLRPRCRYQPPSHNVPINWRTRRLRDRVASLLSAPVLLLSMFCEKIKDRVGISS